MVGKSGRQTSLKIDLGGEQIDLERIEAIEALSSPFVITLDIISLGELDLLPHLGKPAAVTLSQDGELQRYFHGIAVEAEFSRETESGFHYRLTLRPWTYFLSHNRDFAIYQDEGAIDIIKKVLDEAGVSDVDYTRLSKTTPKRVYCVQYNESDFNFISRLMEEEGIYYHFKHSKDRHVLVLCDGPSSHTDGNPATLVYSHSSKSVINVDSAARTESAREYYLQSWVERVSTGAEAKVTVRDFNFEKPDRPLEAVNEANGVHPRDSLEVYTYPFAYADEGQGKKLGGVLLDALRTDRRSYRGRSQSAGLACGTKVTVRKNKSSSSFLIRQTFHSITAERYRTGDGSEDGSLGVVFDAQPAATPFKAPRTTPRPVVHGLESAIITGPDGEEIYTDEYGRVKVRFHWDRSGSPGEKSTCWMRVSQTGGLGNIILPRVGHEVLVDFLGGDPDRPLVVGRVFNKRHMPIYPLPDNKTIALWRTKRYGQTGNYSPGKDLDTGAPGVNELRFEDKGGHEEVFLHAERDMKTRIRYKETHHVGCDQEIKVGHDQNEQVDHDRTTKIGNDDSLQVDNSQKVKVATTIEIEAGTSITLKCGASTIKMDTASIKLESPQITVTGNATAKVTSPLTTVEGTGILTLTGGLVKIN